ncbi:sigma-70 family RNA polymerase sigma factor [Blautia obeum]|jgi:hypothetical protein|uniref:sigma-70 family RNA polymerase sigma factor n=1 Tax=Blautia obeum TaxID=40520 RepID=UPI00319EB7EE
MAYNNGREDRKWRIWKEAEEKVLREHGVDEATIEQIRIDDRADFNSNRRFYHWTSDFGEYLEGMADREQSAEVKTVEDLLDEIEDENLYQAFFFGLAIFFSLHLILLHEFSSNNCTTENYLNQLFTTCYQIYKR